MSRTMFMPLSELSSVLERRAVTKSLAFLPFFAFFFPLKILHLQTPSRQLVKNITLMNKEHLQFDILQGQSFWILSQKEVKVYVYVFT